MVLGLIYISTAKTLGWTVVLCACAWLGKKAVRSRTTNHFPKEDHVSLTSLILSSSSITFYFIASFETSCSVSSKLARTCITFREPVMLNAHTQVHQLEMTRHSPQDECRKFYHCIATFHFLIACGPVILNHPL